MPRFASPPVRRGARVALGLSVLVVAASIAPVVPAAAAGGTMRFGINLTATDDLEALGAKPELGMFWVQVGTIKNGWGGVDKTIRDSQARGVVPVIQWYYWGDSISPDCVENGCDGRTKQGWFDGARGLADRLRANLGGGEAIVIVETEFNKNGITDGSYAPVFDKYLEEQMAILHGAPGVKTAIGFGSWGRNSWGKFPLGIAASDYLSYQALRGSTRQSGDAYLGVVDSLVEISSYLHKTFGKPTFLAHVALSSYPEPEYAEFQRKVIVNLFNRVGDLEAAGTRGIAYRHLYDNPNFPLDNHYGEAERWWGLRHADGSDKPGLKAWVDGIKAYRAAAAPPPPPPPPPPAAAAVPDALEAEAFPAKTTGSLLTDGAASGGKAWNLHSNGSIGQSILAGETRRHEVEVVARGSPAEGEWPRMEVRLDGVRQSAFTVDSPSWKSYRLSLDLAADAPAELRVHYTNNLRTPTEDRNLHVDVVRVTRANEPPAAAFTAGTDGLRASFDASGSSDPDGDPLTFAWDFGDGATGTGTSPTHAYATGGRYLVTLTASDGTSAARATRELVVNRAPAAAFTWSAEALVAAFDAQGSRDPDGDPLSYGWDFGDGTRGEGPTPTHSYATGGSYAVTLTVSDGAAQASTTGRVTVNRAPAAGFTWSTSGLLAAFDASGSSDPDGDPLTYVWDFGDGSGGSGATPTHAYATGGTYAVRLTVSDGAASASAMQSLAVNRAPVAGFHWTADALAVKFDARDSNDPDGDALAFAWDFGDGATAAGATPSHAYSASGAYVVRVTVTDPSGASATESATVEVLRAPASRLEAESFENRSRGGRYADATASGGEGWALYSRSSISTPFRVATPGDYGLVLRARATPALGEWPLVELRLDGEVVASFRIDALTHASHGARISLDDRDHVLALAFVNDKRTQKEDRNVFLDHVDLVPIPAPITREAEAFPTKTAGGRASDASASGGAFWNLWSNGEIRDGFNAAEEWTYSLEVVAKGRLLGGVGPHAVVTVDGVVVGELDAGTAWETHAFPVRLAKGPHDVRVAYTNDARSATEDRNLHLDAIRIVPSGRL